MSGHHRNALSVWVFRHALFVWIGIVLNLFFAIPLVFYPVEITSFFGIQILQPIWTRACGMLLLIITVFYVPSTFDLARYRVYAWIAIFPSRSFGATFFTVAVFAFGYPIGFISIALLDAVIAVLTLSCLIRIDAIERETKARQHDFMGAAP